MLLDSSFVDICNCWVSMGGLLSIFSKIFPDFYIEVDKRAMLTTGQENTSPPSPSLPRIALKIGNSSSSPPTLTLTLLPPSRDIRDGEGLLGLAGGQDGGRWTRRGMVFDLKSNCPHFSTRPDTSDWSGLAALLVIGRSNRWQEAQARQEASTDDRRQVLMTLRHNVLLFDQAF